jgi:CubicO group peptidase (beta-lactamase class C family)
MAQRFRQSPRRVLFVAALVFVGALAGTLRAQGSEDSDLARALASFKAFYEAGCKSNGIVGSAILFAQGGKPLEHLTFGMADVERGRAVNADTIFHWASITKTFTAIAIMQLRDRGRLSLDDPVVKYVPELRLVHNPFGDVGAITIRHLMTHSAGFRNPTWPWGGDKPWHPFEPTQWAQIVAMLPYTEVEFAPGSKHSYSNPGIIFLGRIIEHLSGDDYEVYIDKNIFKPLEMTRSYFDRTPYHLLPNRSASYHVVNGVPRPAPFDVDTGITVSNGGLNAPLGDMAKYMDFLIGSGARRAVYDGVLARGSLDEMFVPRLPVATDGTDRVSIGLSFFVEDRGGFHLIGHSGDQNGFIAHIYFCPALRAGYVVNYNTQTPPTDAAGVEKTRAFDEAVRTEILTRVFPVLAEARLIAPGHER